MKRNKNILISKENIALKISAIYVIFGGLWILLSDKLVDSLVKDKVIYTWIQLLKGWFFVITTGLILYLLMKRGVEQLVKTQKALKDSENNLLLSKAVFDHSVEGIMVCNSEGEIQLVNPAFTRITGYSQEEVIGKNPSILKSGKQTKEFYKSMWSTLLQFGHWQGEIWNRRKNGEIYLEWITITAVNENEEPQNFIAFFRDITELKEKDEIIKYQAYYDQLTGLPNRRMLNEQLNLKLSQNQDDQKLAILILDLDQFKWINDAFGHTFGDALLKNMAVRLKGLFDDDIFLARLGGDEFILLIENTPSRHVSFCKHVEIIAQKVLKMLDKPFMIQEEEIIVTASVGISLFPDDAKDMDTLLKNADVALYRAKDHGGNTYQYYTDIWSDDGLRQLTLQKHLRKALTNKEFIIHYQPRIDIRSGKINGMEALLRWKNPKEGLISPTEFIPLAEKTNLIIPIGEWVMRTACKQNKKWQDMGYPPIRVSVNISPRQLQRDNLMEMVHNALKESGLQPHYLEIEITESDIMKNPEKNIEMLTQLKEMGVHISVDDFGTGYSSLNYLKRLPIDTLKIDRSFIKDIDTDRDNAAIVEAIITLAHQLHLKVVAEGVETKTQEAFLQKKCCDEIQGYLFSRPVPAEEFEEMLILEKCI
ncbi:EAL domain-containing protein [Microaerobacter geothermalis]|uniref:putative bifunctional diguanylate cyclase/phosphodiesterase n=1 Tax=Microaerobacter geothermalis TaxID=674972 RepID=UPI001F294F84|nr:EAL domain-containing protein [Microaerobacter geothermalis]MCF6093969.1 EAL domain-containing protein [Microaerobacter geothermalis]